MTGETTFRRQSVRTRLPLAILASAVAAALGLVGCLQIEGNASVPSGSHAALLAAGHVDGYSYHLYEWAKSDRTLCYSWDMNRALHVLGTGNGGGCTSDRPLLRSTVNVDVTTNHGLWVVSGVAGPEVARVRLLSRSRVIDITTINDLGSGGNRVFGAVVVAGSDGPMTVEGDDAAGKTLSIRTCTVEICGGAP